MKIAILGVSGMAGHVVATYFADRGHEVHGFARSSVRLRNVHFEPIDLSSLTGVIRIEALTGFDVIVNCVGVLPKSANADPANAVLLNSFLPLSLVRAFRRSSTRIVHLSTDCVFSGRSGGYTEHAFRDGDSVYDRSKALGEFESDKDLVLRQSIVGPEVRTGGVGLLHWFLNQSGPIPGFQNAIWNGVTTLELASGVEWALDRKLTGLYHLVTANAMSKYEMLLAFSRTFGRNVDVQPAFLPEKVDKSLLNTSTGERYPTNTFEVQLRRLYAWMLEHREIYEHYNLPSEAARDGVGKNER